MQTRFWGWDGDIWSNVIVFKFLFLIPVCCWRQTLIGHQTFQFPVSNAILLQRDGWMIEYRCSLWWWRTLLEYVLRWRQILSLVLFRPRAAICLIVTNWEPMRARGPVTWRSLTNLGDRSKEIESQVLCQHHREVSPVFGKLRLF